MNLRDDDQTADTWENIDTTNDEPVVAFEEAKPERKSPRENNTNNAPIPFDDGHTPYKAQFSTILRRDKSRLEPTLNLSETLPRNEILSIEDKKKIYKEARQRIFKKTK